MLTEIRHKVNLDVLIRRDNGGECALLFTFHFSTWVLLGPDTLEAECHRLDHSCNMQHIPRLHMCPHNWGSAAFWALLFHCRHALANDKPWNYGQMGWTTSAAGPLGTKWNCHFRALLVELQLPLLLLLQQLAAVAVVQSEQVQGIIATSSNIGSTRV